MFLIYIYLLIIINIDLSVEYGVHIFDDKSLYNDEMIQRAIDYHSNGLSLALNDQYEEALSLLRASLRNNPNNTDTLNDLGVTEMRTGDLQRAKKRFWRCLKLIPNDEDCLRNLEDLKRYMEINDYNEGILDSYPQKHGLIEPYEIDPMELYFMTTYDMDSNIDVIKLFNAPFVVRNALQTWNLNISALQINNLINNNNNNNNDNNSNNDYSNSLVDFYPHGMKEESVHPFFASLKESIDWINDPIGSYPRIDASEEGTYIQWNLDVNIWNDLLYNRLIFQSNNENKINNKNTKDQDFVLPSVFDDTWWLNQCFDNDNMRSFALKALHWRMIVIGERHAGMFNHKDYLPTASYQIQLEGRKKWHLCSPYNDPYMYNAAYVNTFEPDYIKAPEFQKAKCIQTILNPGDVLYYPDNYWHQTLNLDTYTSAIGSSIIRKSNYKRIQKLLQEECAGKRVIFAPDVALCEHWEKCFPIWSNHYEDGMCSMKNEES